MVLQDDDNGRRNEGELVVLGSDPGPTADAMSELLSGDGFRVETVRPFELFDAVRVRRPAVVVLRLGADRRCLGLVDILRGDPLGRRTSIVVTCDPSVVSAAEAARAGANGCFEEPVDEARLLARLAQLAEVPRRIALEIPVTLRRLGATDELPVPARTVDASETGLLLSATAPLQLDASYLLEARVSRGDFLLVSRVVRQACERGPGCFGLAFQHAPDLMRHAVAAIHAAAAPAAA